MTMRLKLLGVRGSRPTHKRHLLGYGGNSTSFELTFRDEPFYLFVDGGTGLARRGHELGKSPKYRRFHFLVTHTHWDHILGYPFFEPIYSQDNLFNFYASATTRSSFHELFFGLQRINNLPVPLAQIKANLNFETLTPAVPFFLEEKVKVTTLQLNHQGVTLGFRIEYGNASVCIVTDNAPIANGNWLGEGMKEAGKRDPTAFERAFDADLVRFLAGAHTVVFDTHFTEATLKADWGHSTPERALDFCQRAGTKRLILFHHAPEDSDADVDAKVSSITAEGTKSGVEVTAAREREEWDLCA